MNKLMLNLLLVAMLIAFTITGCPPGQGSEGEGEGASEGEGEGEDNEEVSPLHVFTTGAEAAAGLEGRTVVYSPTNNGKAFAVTNVAEGEPLVIDDLVNLTEIYSDIAAYVEFDMDPRTFTLYGEKYSAVWVGSKGDLVFDPDLPADDSPRISGLESDSLSLGAKSAILAGIVSDSLVVDYDQLETTAKQDGTTSFQIQCDLDPEGGEPGGGSVAFVYDDINDDLTDIIIGISNGDPESFIDTNPSTLAAKIEFDSK